MNLIELDEDKHPSVIPAKAGIQWDRKVLRSGWKRIELDQDKHHKQQKEAVEMKRAISVFCLMLLLVCFVVPVLAQSPLTSDVQAEDAAPSASSVPVENSATQGDGVSSGVASVSPGFTSTEWDRIESFYKETVDDAQETYGEGLRSAQWTYGIGVTFIAVIIAIIGVIVGAITVWVSKIKIDLKEKELTKKIERKQEEDLKSLKQILQKEINLTKVKHNKFKARMHYFLGRLLFDVSKKEFNFKISCLKEHDCFFEVVNILPMEETEEFKDWYKNALEDVEFILKNNRSFAASYFKDTKIKESLNKAHHDLRLYSKESWFDEIKGVATRIEKAIIDSQKNMTGED